MLELNQTLLAVQDSKIRKPIIELISYQEESAIPFTGRAFNLEINAETTPVVLSTSSGRYIALYIRNYNLYFLYSDDLGISWIEVNTGAVHSVSGYTPESMDAIELTNENIGVVYVLKYLTATYAYGIVLDQNGNVQTARFQIFNRGSSDYSVTGISVVKNALETYIITYIERYLTDYGVYKRTSTNFISWSAASEINTGFTATYKHYDTRIKSLSSSTELVLLISVVDSVSDTSEIVNTYLAQSTDNGATWSTFTNISNIVSYGNGAYSPSIIGYSSVAGILAYSKQESALIIDSDTPFFQSDCGSYSFGARVFYDSGRKYLYSLNIYLYAGSKILCSVTVIDTENWSIHRSYTSATTPKIPDVFRTQTSSYFEYCSHVQGYYISYSTKYHAILINDNDETITHFTIIEDSGYSVNVSGIDFRGASNSNVYLAITRVDSVENKLYFAIVNNYFYDSWLLIGYIDLSEEPVGGVYSFNEVIFRQYDAGAQNQIYVGGLSSLIIDTSLIITSSCSNNYSESYKGEVLVFNKQTGDLISRYSYDEDVGFPYRGIEYAIYSNGIIYGNIEYTSLYNQENYRGLVVINTSTGAITYKRPTYATKDEYPLKFKVIYDNFIVIAALEDGVITYDIDSGVWAQYSESTYPDIFAGYGESTFVYGVDFDPDTDKIFAGCPDYPIYNGYENIKAFSIGGTIKRIFYKEIEKSGGVWQVSSSELSLTKGELEDQPYLMYTNDTLWLLWEHTDPSIFEKSVYYGNTETEYDLTPYLTEDEVQLSFNISGNSSLSFSLSNGHLFDPSNTLSTLNKFTEKSRRIAIRIGESVNGTDYWANQGIFYIDTSKIKYKRGEYPVISFGCVDILGVLNRAYEVASESYENEFPENIIADLLENIGGIDSSSINIGTFSTRHTIDYQLSEEDLLSAIEDMLSHFEYFLYSNMEGIIEARKIKVVYDSLDAEYSFSKIIEITPDDNFSSWTNQVTVTGESEDPIEVLYDEGLLTSVSGSGGWWLTGSDVLTVYYSDDKETKARNARLEVLQSISDFEILWQQSQGTEYLSAEDVNGYYCEITIEWPGLMAVLIGLIASIIALGVVAIECDYFGICGEMIMAFSILVSAISYLLGQIATYSYEIYGRQYGEEYEQFEATADDTELQEKMGGRIVNETIDDPFCTSESECQRVADYELGVVKCQRKRISFSMVTNLQTEIGDIIRVYHPYSNIAINIFVTNLTRVFKRSKEEIYLLDDIQGWRL